MRKSDAILFSLIIPTYNNPDLIKHTLSKLKVFKKFIDPKKQLQVVIVNDGGKLFRGFSKLKKEVARLDIVDLKKNYGKGFAIDTGFKKAKGKFVIFMDDDNDISPLTLRKTISALLKGADVVYANKYHKLSRDDRKGVRYWGGRFVTKLIRSLFSIPLKDTQTGLKGYKRKVYAQIFKRRKAKIKGFAFEVENAVILKEIMEEKKLKVKEIPAVVRRSVKTRVSFKKTVLFFYDVFKVWWSYRGKVFLRKVLKWSFSFAPLIFVVGLYTFLFFKAYYYDNKYMYFSYLVFGDYLATGAFAYSYAAKLFPVGRGHPLFCGGAPAPYHIGFWWLTGLLMRITSNYNLVFWIRVLAIFSFIALVLGFRRLTYIITKNKTISNLSPLVFVIDPSLEGLLLLEKIQYLKDYGLLGYLKNVLQTKLFFQSLPYHAKDPVLLFWNLNTLLNQPHFIMGFALFVWLIIIWYYAVHQKRIKIRLFYELFLAVGTILLFFVHRPSFGAWGFFHFSLAIILLYRGIKRLLLNIFYKNKQFVAPLKEIFQKSLPFISIGTLLGASVVFVYLRLVGQLGANLMNQIKREWGFLYNVSEFYSSYKFALAKWIVFWYYNLGFSIFLIPLGILIYKKILNVKSKEWSRQGFASVQSLTGYAVFLTGLLLFAFANTFKFYPDTAVGHKLINSAFYLCGIWIFISLYAFLKSRLIVGKFMIFLLILLWSVNLGLNLYPYFVKGYAKFSLPTQSRLVRWLKRNTNPNECILALTYNTWEITAAGRSVYLGWDYYPWSMGYNTLERRLELQHLIDTIKNPSISTYQKRKQVCNFVKERNIRYVYVEDTRYVERNITKSMFKGVLTVRNALGNGMFLGCR